MPLSSRWPGRCLDTESYRMARELHDFLYQSFGIIIDLAWFPPTLISSECSRHKCNFLRPAIKFANQTRPKWSKQRAEVVLFPAQMISSWVSDSTEWKNQNNLRQKQPKALGPPTPLQYSCVTWSLPWCTSGERISCACCGDLGVDWRLQYCGCCSITKSCPTLCDSMHYWRWSRF